MGGGCVLIRGLGLGHAMLRYSVGVGLGVMRVRVSGRCFVASFARRVFKD